MRAFLAVALFATVAGSASAAKHPSACALLTNAEAGKALGARIAYVTPQSGPVQSCTWNSAPLSKATSVRKWLMVQLTAKTEAVFVHDEGGQQGSVPIRGIGKIAFGTPGNQVVQLAVWKDGYAFTVFVTYAASPLKTELGLARIVAQHL
ncbi:MAG TPA: hypothetical protein VH063_12765 [Gaiellaceae bacterium]|nr:hypothetical protein [Gaiellaceae bacterium]